MIHVPYVAPGAVVLGGIFTQVSGALIYGPLFGNVWLEAMKKDKGNTKWMNPNKEEGQKQMWKNIGIDFVFSLVRSWCIGLLLNLTQARTCSQAFQLGSFLYVGVVLPMVISESNWESRPCDLQKFKFANGFLCTVVSTVLLHWWGTA
ncbi:hypothetical protein BGZ73_008617 [Actinomortierella ambigua]|nr:hypothetical protein BGZ73_008617 [Actinomortierella ambigua]